MEERYFAASNSGKGFVSYFGEIFDPECLEHIYIIKGGPGTGKSYFMRMIATEAEKKGKKVVYYYCSSDQSSLDGIIIDEKIAFLDGTAPHDTDATIPGAVEDLIDLGVFWSSEQLSLLRKDIEKLNCEKKRHYKRAYSYLAAYHDISEGAEKIIEPLLDREKIKKSIRVLLKDISRGKGYSQRTAICDSVGMGGRIRFDTLEKKAEKILRISDLFDTAHFYLAEVANFAFEKDMAITLSYDPINFERLDSVYFDNEKILFTACGEEKKDINMSRFIDKKGLSESRTALKNAMKLRSIMLDEAILALEDVKKSHFAIEKIYIGAMDFEAKEKFTHDFISRLEL